MLELTGTLTIPESLRPHWCHHRKRVADHGQRPGGLQDRHLTRVDEGKLAREGEAVCAKVLREPCETFHNLG